MTPLRLSTLRALALLVVLLAASSANGQVVRAPAFPVRPAGTACEERLQRMRLVATPTVKRDEFLAALVPLYACKEPELGQGIAAAIVGVRTSTDSARVKLAFGTGAFAYRDSAIVRAAVQVQLTPRSPALIASIGDVAKSVRSDTTASPALRSAAACVLTVWRR